MEKNIEISILNEIYGKLLTKKQFEIIDNYYNQDLSLTEIAENNEITRQAVRDILKKGEKKLYEYEKHLHFMKKAQKKQQKLDVILEQIEKIQKQALDQKTNKQLQDIKKELKNLK